MLEILLSIASVLVFAACVLWGIEALKRAVGAKWTIAILLGVLPTLVGATVAYLNRATLHWWEMALYALGGPVIAVGLLLMGYLAVSPFGIPDLLSL